MTDTDTSTQDSNGTRGFLDEVAQVVGQTGDGRGRFYGHPNENHGATADMWSTYLNRKFGTKIQLDARDVCMMNVTQKVSRDANRPKRDNLLDIAGYAENAERIAQLVGTTVAPAPSDQLDDRVRSESLREWQDAGGGDSEAENFPTWADGPYEHSTPMLTIVSDCAVVFNNCVLKVGSYVKNACMRHNSLESNELSTISIELPVYSISTYHASHAKAVATAMKLAAES